MADRSQWMFGTLMISGKLIPVIAATPGVRHNSTLTRCIRWHLHVNLAPITSKDLCFVGEGKLSRAVTTAKESATPHLLMDGRS